MTLTIAALYDSELNSVLNDLIPFRVVTRRLRSSDPWFDNDCFEDKRRTRRLERAYGVACRRQTAQHNTGSSTGVDDAKATWYAQRRSYRDLCQMKCSAFWCDTVERDRESPRKLWRPVNQLLGRGRPPAI